MYSIVMVTPRGNDYYWHPNEQWVVGKVQLWTEGEMIREIGRVLRHVTEYSNNTFIYVINAKTTGMRIEISINRD